MEEGDSKPRRAGIFQVVKAVAWAFFGVRKNKDYHSDIGKITPVQAIAVGIVAAILFVLGLVVLVSVITS